MTRLWLRLRNLWRSRLYRDLDDELRLHLEMATGENLRAGMTPEEARLKARRELGNAARVHEEVYHMNSIAWFDAAARSVRHTLRVLRRNPSFAITSLLTLAIGIGANTAVYSVLNSVLLKPLRYPNAGELVSVQHSAPGGPSISDVSGDLRLSPSMFFTYFDQNRVFQSIGAWTANTGTVTGQGDPEEVRIIGLTEGLLEALQVPPAAGRWLSNEDQKPGGPLTVLLSYGYWQRRFGGDTSALGRSIQVAAVPRQIVGVMPQGFRVAEAEADIFVPFQFNRAQLILPGFFLQSIARLRPGVSIDDAGRDIARLVPVWNSSWPPPPGVPPQVWEQWHITPAIRPLKQDVVGHIQSGLWIVMGTIGLVLFIACSNVANLLLVRAEASQKDLAVRAALGAGRARIALELLVESAVLAALGGLLGIATAAGVLKLLVSYGPAGLPRLDEIALDGRSLVFALAASALVGVSIGLIPVLRYAGRRMGLALRAEGRGSSQSKERQRAQNLLVVSQVALALMLLVGSGLMLRSFWAMQNVDAGFQKPEHVETMRLAISQALIQEPERVARTYQEIASNLAALPGVDAVGFASAVPTDGFPTNWDSVSVEGVPREPGKLQPMRRWVNVAPGFFEAMGTRLLAGRAYEWPDLLNRRAVVIISANLARELFGAAGAAIGRRIGTGPGRFREVVGVVQDVYANGVQQTAPATVYWPAFTDDPVQTGTPLVVRNATFAIRSARTGDAAFIKQIEQAVWRVNPSLSLARLQSMGEIHSRSMSRTSFTAAMLAIAGGMALVLGIIGLYGVLAYTVALRRREVGIRIALGAERGEVRLMFLRHGLGLTCIGVLIGLVGATAVTRLLSSLLFGVHSLDPMTFLSAPLVLLAAAFLASYIPAQRAARVDPAETLRSE